MILEEKLKMFAKEEAKALSVYDFDVVSEDQYSIMWKNDSYVLVLASERYDAGFRVWWRYAEGPRNEMYDLAALMIINGVDRHFLSDERQYVKTVIDFVLVNFNGLLKWPFDFKEAHEKFFDDLAQKK